MQLEQPPPDLAVPDVTPFDHLRPTLWRASKVAHITLVSLGSLMLLPAGLVMLALANAFFMFGRGSIPSEVWLPLISAVGSTCLGVLAWAALSLLFFKRNDARWQRVCWGFCAAFGIVATPCIVGWIVWMSGEGLPSDAAWVYLIFLGMLATAIASISCGCRFSLAAARALGHPPTEEDRAFYV